MTPAPQPHLSEIERRPHHPTGTVADLTGPVTGRIAAAATYDEAARSYTMSGEFVTAPTFDAPPSVRVVVLGGWSNRDWVGQRSSADRVEIEALTDPWVTVAGRTIDSRLGVAVVAASWLTPVADVDQPVRADTATAGPVPFGGTLDLTYDDDQWIAETFADAVHGVRLTRWAPPVRPLAVTLSAVPGDSSNLVAVVADRTNFGGVGFAVVPASTRRLAAELPRDKALEQARRDADRAAAVARS